LLDVDDLAVLIASIAAAVAASNDDDDVLFDVDAVFGVLRRRSTLA